MDQGIIGWDGWVESMAWGMRELGLGNSRVGWLGGIHGMGYEGKGIRE